MKRYTTLLSIAIFWLLHTPLQGQLITSASFFACVGEPQLFYVDKSYIDSNYFIVNVDSVYWYMDDPLNRDHILVMDTMSRDSQYFTFNGTYGVQLPDNPWPEVRIVVYITRLTGEVDSLIQGGALGGTIECEIRYAGFRTDRQSICAGDCVNFRDTSDRYPSWHRWYFPGGTPSYSDQRHPGPICYDQPGNYPVKLVVGNSINSDSTETLNYIRVSEQIPPPMERAFELEAYSGDTLELLACGDGAFFQWQPTTGLSCTDCPNPKVAFTQNIQYQLTYWNDTACVETCSYAIKQLYRPETIYTPNVFSPNNDDNNDLWQPFGLDVVFQRLEVFDRWGNLLVLDSTTNPSWDGMAPNGRPADIGVYIFQLIYVDLFSGQNRLATGTITLVR
jgi:gliding motility-associated-like protein